MRKILLILTTVGSLACYSPTEPVEQIDIPARIDPIELPLVEIIAVCPHHTSQVL